jgi:hypothetical protein
VVKHRIFFLGIAALEELQIREALFQVSESLRMHARPYLPVIAGREDASSGLRKRKATEDRRDIRSGYFTVPNEVLVCNNETSIFGEQMVVETVNDVR